MINENYPKCFVLDSEKRKNLSKAEFCKEIICNYFEQPEIYRLVGDKCRSKTQRAVDDFLFVIMDTIYGIFEGINLVRDFSKKFYLVYSRNQFYLVIIFKKKIEIDKLPENIVSDEFVYNNYKYRNTGKLT